MLDSFYVFINYFLIFLCLLSILGLNFAKKHKDAEQGKSVRFKKLYKHCPCRKAVDSGFLSVVCTYSGVGAFMLSVLNMGFIANYEKNIIIMFFLSLFTVAFAFILKK